jgi:hypothetical protein
MRGSLRCIGKAAPARKERHNGPCSSLEGLAWEALDSSDHRRTCKSYHWHMHHTCLLELGHIQLGSQRMGTKSQFAP